jgi:hypothetical protein
MLAFLVNDLLSFISYSLFTILALDCSFCIENPLPFLFWWQHHVKDTVVGPSSPLAATSGQHPWPAHLLSPCRWPCPAHPLPSPVAGGPRRCPSLTSSNTGWPLQQVAVPTPLLGKQQDQCPSSTSSSTGASLCEASIGRCSYAPCPRI